MEEWFSDPTRAAGTYPSIDSLPVEVFAPMLEWRKSVISSLLDELEEVAGTTKLRQMVSLDPTAQKMVSVEPVVSAKKTGGLLALGYVKDGPALRKPLESLITSVHASDVTLGLQVGLPESGGKKEFLEKMSTARELGINSFNFYNYGLIPAQNLSWISESLGH